MQSVFLAVLQRRRSELRSLSDPAAWLLTLTRNAALSRCRVRRREEARVQGLGSCGRGPAEPVHASVEGEGLDAALAALPRHLREVVVLKHAGGLSFDQIATALGANRNTLASRYRVAMIQLRRALGADQGSPPSTPHREVLHARP